MLSACANRTPASLDAGFIPVPVARPSCADIVRCEQSCQQGDARDCVTAANSYSFGKGVAQDEHRAAELFVRSCSLGSGAGCTLAGRMYEFAHGVPQDSARAVSLYERACRLDDMGGCYNFAFVLENGRGVARDEERALTLYQTVCAQGSNVACAAASRAEAQIKATPPGDVSKHR